MIQLEKPSMASESVVKYVSTQCCAGEQLWAVTRGRQVGESVDLRQI